MDSGDSTLPGRDAAIPLDPGKTVHVFTDRSLTGVERELESRRFIWIHAIERTIAMLKVSIRARAWFLEDGSKWDCIDQSFPTPVDAILASRGLAQMAAITFLTVFKSGWGDDGRVAGNSIYQMRAFREQCLTTAFSNAVERERFNALLNRLERARDGLLAHADGASQEMVFTGVLTSFGLPDDGISQEDVGELLGRAVRLSKVVRCTRVA